jgi:hypothetical protein
MVASRQIWRCCSVDVCGAAVVGRTFIFSDVSVKGELQSAFTWAFAVTVIYFFSFILSCRSGTPKERRHGLEGSATKYMLDIFPMLADAASVLGRDS